MVSWFKARRRRKLLAKPFPDHWLSVLDSRVHHYRQLPDPMRKRLRTCVQIIVTERNFEGVGGLELTDEIKVTVAGQASLLLLGVDGYFFERVPTILITPSAYSNPQPLLDEGHVDEDQMAAGEAWMFGPIVLSWDNILRGGSHAGDGSNVVLHEFAHHLDGLDGEMGGTPPIANAALRRRWSQVSRREYDRLLARLRQGQSTLIDEYGATNRAEFFAVSTESFFERPREMREDMPQWYSVLAEFYCLDPAEWAWTW